MYIVRADGLFVDDEEREELGTRSWVGVLLLPEKVLTVILSGLLSLPLSEAAHSLDGNTATPAP